VQTPLHELHIQKEQDGWTVVETNAGEYLSFRFSYHFFDSLQQIAAYMQNEIQQIADSHDWAGEEGLQQLDNDGMMAVYYQYIDNVSHMVVMAARLLTDRPGIFYIGVTKSESMTHSCRQLFLGAKPAPMTATGQREPKTEKQLAGRILRYLDAYTSNTYGGGGTSTDKSFSLFEDGSFRYAYASMVSMGSFGGSTSRNEGYGCWEIRKEGQQIFLVLRWHLESMGMYRLEWGNAGVVHLDNEKFLMDRL